MQIHRRERPCEDADRDWSDAATNQQSPGPPLAGRGEEGSPLPTMAFGGSAKPLSL